MSRPLRVLIIEDSEDDTLLLLHELRCGGFAPAFERVDTPAVMKAALVRQAWDVIISDYVMPQFSAPAALMLLQASGLDLPFIIVSGNIDEDAAMAAMRTGAHDYILKGNLARLIPVLERELHEAEVRREHNRAAEQLLQAQNMEVIERLVGKVAHDFNNIMTTILGFGQLALRRLSEDDPVRRNIEEIIKAGERATALSRQLLAFDRKQAPNPKVLDPSTVIDDLVSKHHS